MSEYKEDAHLLLRAFALGSDNKSLHRYLFDTQGKNFAHHLSRNLNIEDSLYLELLPHLQIKDKIVSLQRPLTECLAQKIFEDKSPVVRQAIFQVTHPSYPFSDELITKFLSQYGNTAIAKLLATYFNSNAPETSALREFCYQQARRFGRTNTTGEKKLVSSRAHTIREIVRRANRYQGGISEVSHNRTIVQEKMALALSILVYDTYSVIHLSADEIINAVSLSIGEQNHEFWSIFFKMLPGWSNTYQALIQTVHTLTDTK